MLVFISFCVVLFSIRVKAGLFDEIVIVAIALAIWNFEFSVNTNIGSGNIVGIDNKIEIRLLILYIGRQPQPFSF